MTETIFFRLLADDDKADALAQSGDALHEGQETPSVYTINPEAFTQVPASPFAYWVSRCARAHSDQIQWV